MSAAAQIEALHRDELDLGFIWSPISNSEFVCTDLTQERFVVMVNEHHPLAAVRSVSIKDLSGEPLVHLARAMDPELFHTRTAVPARRSDDEYRL